MYIILIMTHENIFKGIKKIKAKGQTYVDYRQK